MNAEPEHQAKIMLGNADRKFDVVQADKIFYEMVIEEGWVKKNFDFDDNRFCRSFVYEFICKLFDGNVLNKKNGRKNL